MKIVEDQCVQSWSKTSAILSPPHLCSLSLRVIRRCQERPLLKLFITYVSACSLSLTHTSTKLTRIPMTPTLCVQRAHTHTHFKMGFPWHERWGRQEMGSKHPDQMNERDCVSTLQWACTFLKTPYSKTDFFFFSFVRLNT